MDTATYQLTSTVWCTVKMSVVGLSKMKVTVVILAACFFLAAHSDESKHLQNITRITFGGTNAEAYFNFKGTRLSFQSTRPPYKCDQIFSMNIDGSDVKLVSTGTGRTTCSYYYPDGKHILYASTMLGGTWCPAKPDMSHDYLWAVYKDFDIFLVNTDNGNLSQLTNSPGYDAEATLSPDGKMIVFTTDRDGDLELYTMNLTGGDVRRRTYTPGYDGGAFFSHDSQKLVYRASRPQGQNLTNYLNLLNLGLVEPSQLEIYTMDLDGNNITQLTNNGQANFAPFYLPDDSGVIFSSNYKTPPPQFGFHLYVVKNDAPDDLEQITFNGTFNSFPMFSPDGKKLVFASDRDAKQYGDIDIYIADWIP